MRTAEPFHGFKIKPNFGYVRSLSTSMEFNRELSQAAPAINFIDSSKGISVAYKYPVCWRSVASDGKVPKPGKSIRTCRGLSMDDSPNTAFICRMFFKY